MTSPRTPALRKRARTQCAKCPWKVTTDPFDIPDGYCPTKHAALAGRGAG